MSRCVGHEPCPNCGSKDNLARYEDGSAHCFSPSCTYFEPKKEGGAKISSKPKKKVKLYYEGDSRPLASRKINQKTAEAFKVIVNSKNDIVYPYYDTEGNMVATRVRKSGDKKFLWTGDVSKATMFGMQRFGTGGKYLTITEGQDDTLAAYYMLGSKWPVISVHSATEAARNIKDNLDYIETFDNVVFIFDNDEAGRNAVQACAELLSPGKAKIVTLNAYKDANDYLKAGRASEFSQEFWNFKTFSAVGVVSFEDAWSSVVSRKEAEILPFPSSMPLLNAMMKGGLAKGEITTVGALTSVGKTTFVNNTLHGFLTETDNKIGYLGLETTVGELTSSLIDLEAQKKVSEDETLNTAKEVFDNITWKDKLHIIDHQGSLQLESMIKKIRNTIIAFDLDIFILDPLQQALPDLNNDTVKYAMDSLLKLAKQTNVAFLLVSHMRKPDGDNPHNVSEYDLLGSSAINQVSFNTILLSRDKMGSSDSIKSSTRLRLVKCRRTGNTGDAGWLYYDKDTGTLQVGENPYLDFDDEEMM